MNNQSVTQMLINYAPLIILFVIGWFFGSRHERQHLARLAVSEKSLAHIVVSSERFYKPTLEANSEGELVLGSVVIAQDYFKMVVARVLNLFGKNLTTYETLLIVPAVRLWYVCAHKRMKKATIISTVYA